MDTTAIDVLTQDFYKTISFELQPNYDEDIIGAFFFGAGIMVNNGFRDPVCYNATTFVQEIVAQVANGDIEYFRQREVSSTTEIFGKIARRTSIYEYSFEDHDIPNPTRGINYIQYVYTNGQWKMVSMVWADENEDHLVAERTPA